ncbi:hypothetical protein [Paludibaculum fermentans]|uniref:Uncharacterized protein n=1 Tax=Paludibaculum fermentans TaxID=1473598 RepID=A0A7S7NK00_PALFE|nr:hypothetical protein [Paludibaculum fermentans]QOY85007.1 hypothetical protein IRI77_19345 [Paludibaculum fermentans]
MRLTRLALAFLACATTAWNQTQRQAPSYSADSIVNLASGERGRLAPNTLAAIYGKNLAPYSRARDAGDLQGNVLPYQLSGTGVTVRVGSLLAPVEYISPEVVTFLVPSELRAGPASIVLTYNFLSGPTIRVQLLPAAPAWFLMETGYVLGRHLDSMQWIDDAHPARPGERVVLYAAGLGDSEPVLPYRQVPREEVPLARLDRFRLLIGGLEMPVERLGYVGLTPGFPGVYEVNVVLPAISGPDPEVSIELPGAGTEPGIRLRLQPTPPQPDVPPLRSIK